MDTAAELIRTASARLRAAGVETARLDAEVLLRHVLGIDRTTLFTRLRDAVDQPAAATFEQLVSRRLTGEPVAYITGEREFMGLPFAVGPGVLVPRPETEFIVEWAISWLQGRQRGTVIDAGTGSGAIILSLADHLPAERGDLLVGIDLSAAALAYAVRNRRRLALEHRVHLAQGDLLKAIGQPVDLVLANLPYLTPGQVAENPDLSAEPREALISGTEGLDAIARLIADLPRVLAPHGAVALELDPGQASGVAAMLQARFPGAHVTIVADLAEHLRFVIAETDPSLHATRA